jgi:YD repeat-containing protein
MNNSEYDMVSGSSSYAVTNMGTQLLCLPQITKNTSLVYSSSSRQGYGNSNVTYEYVTEYDVDSLDNSLGRTEYKFTSNPNFIVDDNKNHSIWINNQSKRSKLINKQIFNSDNKLLIKEENFYSEEPSVMNYRSDFKFYCNTSVSSLDCNATPIDYRLEDRASVFRTNLGLNWHKKDRTELTNYFYDVNGTLINQLKTSTDYTYNGLNQEIKKTTTPNSKGEILKTEIEYPQDLVNPTAAEQNLIDNNRLAIPIKTKTFKKAGTNPEKELSYLYTKFNNTKWPGLNLPEKVQTSKGSQPLEDRIIYHSYDNKGNPIEVSKKDGTKIYYVWGYEQTQPIAKIENYSSLNSTQQTAINNAVTASNLDDDRCLDSENCDEKTVREKLTLVRTAFPNSMVTTYTYDPLIGVTSITDPRGETVYYHYDDFNRLQFVKDAEGNILSKNEYNYKN